MKNRRSGFSLIEICVALVVLSFALMLMMQLSMNSYMLSKDARSRDAAKALAKTKITELSTQVTPIVNDSDMVTFDNISCRRSWAIVSDGIGKQIVVKVSYKSIKGPYRSITLAGALQ